MFPDEVSTWETTGEVLQVAKRVRQSGQNLSSLGFSRMFAVCLLKLGQVRKTNEACITAYLRYLKSAVGAYLFVCMHCHCQHVR